MAVLTRSALDASNGGGATEYFSEFRFLDGVADNLGDLTTRIDSYATTPRYFLVRTVSGSVYFINPNLVEIKRLDDCQLLIFTDVGFIKNSSSGLHSVQNSNYSIWVFPATGISSSTLTDGSVYSFEFWRTNVAPKGVSSSIFVNGGADELVFTDGVLTAINSGS